MKEVVLTNREVSFSRFEKMIIKTLCLEIRKIITLNAEGTSGVEERRERTGKILSLSEAEGDYFTGVEKEHVRRMMRHVHVFELISFCMTKERRAKYLQYALNTVEVLRVCEDGEEGEISVDGVVYRPTFLKEERILNRIFMELEEDPIQRKKIRYSLVATFKEVEEKLSRNTPLPRQLTRIKMRPIAAKDIPD